MSTALIFAATALAIAAMACMAASRAWRGWLELKRLELEAKPSGPVAPDEGIGVRIELAAVRERLKKLEAIASGVEL